MKRLFFILSFIFLFNNLIFTQVLNDSQIINPDSQIYKELNELQMNNQLFFFSQNTPMSAGEIKMYLRQMDYDNLSEYSKQLYDSICTQLNKKNMLPYDNLQFDIKPRINIEGYYKTNKDISWSHDYFFKDNLITIPIKFGFGDLFSITSDIFVGKNQVVMQKNDSFTNIPFSFNDLNFFFPTFAYGSFGKTYDDWGYNFHFGKQGKTIGNTITGSIIYNSTFETDGYAEFVIFSNWMKYTCDVVQVSGNRMDNVQTDNIDRYLYLHQYDFRLFKKAKFSVFEGSLVCNPMSLRFLNPLIIMHQFGGWSDYDWPAKYADNDTNNFMKNPYKFYANKYRETNFCAIFAGLFELIPTSNLRLYGLYDQIEFQLPWERKHLRGRYMPNSFALQFGGEYNYITKNSSLLNFALEGVYTSPYMYIKQTPSASLYRFRNDMQSGGKIYSWMGTPFGPNSLAGQFRVKYQPAKKWNCEFDYLICAKGPKDFSIFENYSRFSNETEEGGETIDIYYYYPTLKFYLIYYGLTDVFTGKDYSKENLDALYQDAISLGFAVAPEISNQFCVKANYNLTDKIDLSGKIIYELLLNVDNQVGNVKSGIELSLAFTYNFY